MRRRNSHEHEIRIPVRPVQRLLFCFKKPVNDQGASLKNRAAGAPRCLPADNCRAGIDREQSPIGKSDFAAVWNPARIDRAMAGLQARAGGTDMALRPAIRTAAAARPVDRDPRENGFFAGKSRRRE